MSQPKIKHWKALRRLVLYVARARWLKYCFDWQEAGQDIIAYVDTDFVGCRETRRSTNGGLLFHGKHLIKQWATTQKVVVLSSAEAELGGIVKGAGEALGLQSIAADIGLKVRVKLLADASAAIGICRRSGIGKVRHLAVGQLWV